LAELIDRSEPQVLDGGLPFQVYFDEPDVSFADLAEVLDVLDREFRRVQDGVLAVAPYFGNFNSIIIDASRQRLRQASRQAVRLSAFRRGSLVVNGTLAVIVVGILKSTIGESVKQGWQESELHDDIVAFTKSSLNSILRDSKSFAASLRGTLARRLPHVTVRQDEPGAMISIRVRRRRDDAA